MIVTPAGEAYKPTVPLTDEAIGYLLKALGLNGRSKKMTRNYLKVCRLKSGRKGMDPRLEMFAKLEEEEVIRSMADASRAVKQVRFQRLKEIHGKMHTLHLTKKVVDPDKLEYAFSVTEFGLRCLRAALYDRKR